jgi:hypothetical protein
LIRSITLLARQNRLRVEAEIVRDAALAASGLLSIRRVGGPGVKPPQPEGVYAFTQNEEELDRRDRARSLPPGVSTLQFYRSAPYPLLTTFDSPDFQSVPAPGGCGRTRPCSRSRWRTTKALFELAQGLGARLLREVPADDASATEARLERAFFSSATPGRPPRPRTECGRVLPARASWTLVPESLPPPPRPSRRKITRKATESRRGRVVDRPWHGRLMNTDEFITRE